LPAFRAWLGAGRAEALRSSRIRTQGPPRADPAEAKPRPTEAEGKYRPGGRIPRKPGLQDLTIPCPVHTKRTGHRKQTGNTTPMTNSFLFALRKTACQRSVCPSGAPQRIVQDRDPKDCPPHFFLATITVDRYLQEGTSSSHEPQTKPPGLLACDPPQGPCGLSPCLFFRAWRNPQTPS